MNNARTQLTAVLALGAALAMPLALAQSAVTPEVRDAQKAATEAADVAQDAAAQDAQATGAQDAQDVDAQPAARQLGWADVDADGNGTISLDESAALPALAAVFAEADADADGELSADEYREYSAKAGGQ